MGSLLAANHGDPHLKQMLDFILLGSTGNMLLTCGSFGGGAAVYNHVSKSVQRYHAKACPVKE